MIDPSSNTVVADPEVGGWPRAITYGHGFVWAAKTGDDAVARLDPVSRLVLDCSSQRRRSTLRHRMVRSDRKRQQLRRAGSPGRGTVERYDPRPAEADTNACRAGRGWKRRADRGRGRKRKRLGWEPDEARVYRLSPRTGKVVANVPVTIQVAGVAVGAGAVWAADPINDVLFRIDPEDAHVAARIPLAAGPRRVAVGEGAVWVTSEFPRSGVWRIDPVSNRAVAHISVPRRAAWVAVGEGSIWVTSNDPGHAGPGVVSRIDPKTNTVVATIDLGFSPEDLVVAKGLVWVVVGPM